MSFLEKIHIIQIYVNNICYTLHTMMHIKRTINFCLLKFFERKFHSFEIWHFDTRAHSTELLLTVHRLCHIEKIILTCNILRYYHILRYYIHSRIRIQYKDNVLYKDYTRGHFDSTCRHSWGYNTRKWLCILNIYIYILNILNIYYNIIFIYQLLL